MSAYWKLHDFSSYFLWRRTLATNVFLGFFGVIQSSYFFAGAPRTDLLPTQESLKFIAAFRLTDKEACLLHCVKSVRIRSYSGPYFPTFGLNTERYGVSLRSISPYSVQMLENADQNNSEYKHFSRSATDTHNRFISNWPSDVNLVSKIHGSTLFH